MRTIVRNWDGRLVAALLLVALGGLPLVLGLQELGYDGTRVQPTQATTFQGRWVRVARLSGCQGTFDVNDRTWAAVQALHDANDANVALWTVPLGANWGQLRWQIDTNEANAVIEGWWTARGYDPGAGDRDQADSFTRGWSWAVTGGGQLGPHGNRFCDTVVATSTFPSAGLTTDSGNNRIALFDVDLRGVGQVAFTRTDSDPNLTVYIDARIY
jgi:hypothetical protein